VKTFVSPEAISSDLIKKIRDIHRKILTLPEMMRTFSGKGEGNAAIPTPICPSAFHLSFSTLETWLKPLGMVAHAYNLIT
jgi:hypothetical protein